MERTPPGGRADYRCFRALTTRWKDNDSYGHVNNAEYYSFIDTAVTAFLITRGLIGPESPVIGFAVESGCRFHQPVSFPEPLSIGLRIGRLGTSSVRYEAGIFRAEGEVAVAEGHFVHVYVDRTSQRPVPLPEAMRQRLQELLVGS